MTKTLTQKDVIDFIVAHKDELRREYGVRRIGLFGSYARDDATLKGDIDIVVDLEKPDLFDLIGIKQTLEEALGSKVDVVRLRSRMNQSLRARIDRDAIYV